MKNRNYPLLLIFWLSLLLGFGSCQKPPVQIQDKPILFNQERKELSLQYIKEHYGLEMEDPVIEPKMVVVHWTDIPTLAGSFDAFYPATLPVARKNIASASALNVSVQYLVDRDGTIYRLLPDTVFARHVIGLNHCAIGIENVGNGTDFPLTDAQLEANVKLIKYLGTQYDIAYVIGHHQYKKFIGSPLWKEKDPDYLTDKVDPGDEFMEKILSRLSSLHLKPIPN